MTPDHDAITALKALLRADPELEALWSQASDIGQFAQAAAASAQRHGITLNAAELQAQLQAKIGQSTADSRPNAELSDQQLSAATGAGIYSGDDLSRMLALDRQQRSPIALSLI